MTHRMLLREIVIDVPTQSFAQARDFWAGALSAEARVVEGHAEFTALDRPASLAVMGLQDVGDGSARFHVDIESDDIEAEVRRLVALGAVEVRRVRGWVVLRDPAGLLLCVVAPESPDFATRSREVD